MIKKQEIMHFFWNNKVVLLIEFQLSCVQQEMERWQNFLISHSLSAASTQVAPHPTL